MSHLSMSHDTSRATAVVRVLSSTTQVHILLSRAIGFIADERYNLAETSFLRATAILDQQSETETATFSTLQAMTVSGMFSFIRQDYHSALRAHERVVEAIPENPMDLVSDDPYETAEYVEVFLRLHAQCLARIRKHIRYNFEDDYALLGALAEAN